MKTCPNCKKEAAEDHFYCGSCSTLLVSQQALNLPSGSGSQGECPCGPGKGKADAEGYCELCGHRRVIQRESFEMAPTVHLAGVSNRGMNARYVTNQDFMTVENFEGASLLVLCDGVSNSQRPQDASEAAVKACCEALKAALAAGAPPKAALQGAVRAANKAVVSLSYNAQAALPPPSTTIVAAVVVNGTAHVSWVGDSRAYWVSPHDSGLLTHDHSYANDLVDRCVTTLEELKNDRKANGISRCLGLLEGRNPSEQPPAPVLSMILPERSKLILCSDGLWGYVEDHAKLAKLVRQVPEEADAMTLARDLVRYARVQGGKDNVTVAAVFLP